MRRLEKRFRRLRTPASYAEWRQQSDHVRDVYQEAFRLFWTEKLADTKGDGRVTWAAANKLLQPFTPAYSSLTVEDFAVFFQQKIADIRQKTAAAPAVRVWNVVHNDVPLRSHWCVLTRGPHTLHLSYDRYWSPTQLSCCQPLSHTITDRRLRLFGHIIRSSRNEDHHSVALAIQKPHSDWKRTKGRPSLASVYVQLRRIWSHWILASRLHGRRQPTGRRSGDQWWTRQRSRRVRNEKKKKLRHVIQ